MHACQVGIRYRSAQMPILGMSGMASDSLCLLYVQVPVLYVSRTGISFTCVNVDLHPEKSTLRSAQHSTHKGRLRCAARRTASLQEACLRLGLVLRSHTQSKS